LFRARQKIDQIVEVALLLGAGRRILAAHHAHETHVVGAIADHVERLHQPRQAIAFDVELLFQLGRCGNGALIDIDHRRSGFRHLRLWRLGRGLLGRGSVGRRALGRWSFGRRHVDASRPVARRRLDGGRVGMLGRWRVGQLGRRRVGMLGRWRVGRRFAGERRARFGLGGDGSRRGRDWRRTMQAPNFRRLSKHNSWKLGDSFHRLSAARALRGAGLTSFFGPLRAS
jgi:hypothetical protein